MHPFIETKYAHISAGQNTFYFIFVQLPQNDYWKQAKLREDLSHVGFKSPHDFLEKNTKHLKREQVIVYRIGIHIYLHRESSGIELQ